MNNLLLSLVSEKELSGRIVQDIKEKAKPDNLYLIVGKTEELPIYKAYGECILREYAAQGIYEEQRHEPEDYFALEDDVLQYMSRYSTQIMHQQRRFELYPDFQIEPDWNSHYTVYMHNVLYWYNFLQKNQITHVFLSAIPHEGYDCVIYHLCRYLGISLKIVHVCFIPFRQYSMDDFMVDDPKLTAEYNRLLKEYEHSSAEEIPLEGKTAEEFERWASRQPDQMKPWYMRTNPFVRRLRQRFYETNIIRIWRGILGEDYVKYGKSPAFLGAAFRKLPELLRMIPVAWKRWRFARPVKKLSLEYRDYYQALAGEPTEGEKYIYFPMHYQPEATSNPMGGGMYADQMIPLRILSRALPDDVKIYVKSHPEQLSPMRTKEYYTELAGIPKVRLMKLETSTYELMKNAMAVASLTGTALWECQFFGVPALAFGYSVKNSAPLSCHVRTVEDCRKALEQIAAKPRKDVLRELKLYTKAMHNVSFEMEKIGEAVPQIIADFVGVGTEDEHI